MAPKLTEHHRMQRLVWCLNNQKTDFSNYIFIDEAKIRLLEVPLYHWRKKSSNPVLIHADNRYKAKINIWGGISESVRCLLIELMQFRFLSFECFLIYSVISQIR